MTLDMTLEFVLKKMVIKYQAHATIVIDMQP